MMIYRREHIRALGDAFIGRQSDYAVQLPTGRYRRAGFPISVDVLQAHLAGSCTLGTYLMDEQGQCFFAVFDADQANGFAVLTEVQSQLHTVGIPAHLEQSRRGGHLWVLLDTPVSARLLRQWLLPFCPPEVEFYPKQDESAGVGSLIRVPLGVHQKSGKRYPLVVVQQQQRIPLASTLEKMLEVVPNLARATVPASLVVQARSSVLSQPHHTHINSPLPSPLHRASGTPTIADWCAGFDPFDFLGRYVSLDRHGRGRCPFGAHHTGGKDMSPSFQVFLPRRPGGVCWRCYTGNISGDLFNFLQMYEQMDAHELWSFLRGKEPLS